ncbi:hypothetical protein I3760_02G135100 [Carya illinoinensis]|nr:hypothetical protein I3760_02G135100 [Carya illinoinensis]
MTMEEPEPNPTSDHILDRTEDSASFFPSFLDDPYNSGDINCYQWWDESPDVGQDLFDYSAIAAATCTVPTNPTVFNHPSPANSSKKRKASDNILSKQSLNYLSPQKNQSQRITNADVGFAEVEEVLAVKKSVENKKSTSKATGHNCNNGKDKEGRWAKQLLNPCAAAITEGNMSRLQHLLCVLQELASHTGDSNRHPAFHGLRALAQHISPTSICSSSSAGRAWQLAKSTYSRYWGVSWCAMANAA